MLKVTAVAAGVVILALALTPDLETRIEQVGRRQVLGQQMEPVGDTRTAPELAATADRPVLSARAALAYDVASGSVLFSENFDQELPVASLTKIVTALVIADSGRLDDVVTVQEADTRVIGANAGLFAYERISARELMKSMLIASHNDATLALARHVGGSIPGFVELMNAKAQALGMRNTHFTDPIGLDFLDHYSTAHDLSLALDAFMRNQYLSELVRTKEADIGSVDGAFTHKVKTTNKLLLEDSSVVGVKTGYTNEAKGNLIIRSVRGDSDVVTIVLGSDDREGDSRKILDWMRTVYRW